MPNVFNYVPKTNKRDSPHPDESLLLLVPGTRIELVQRQAPGYFKSYLRQKQELRTYKTIQQ